MPRVLIVDDHALIRQGIRSLFQGSPRGFELGEAMTGSETLRMLRDRHWEVVVLDLSLPDRTGIDLLREVKEQFPGTAVVVCSVHKEFDYALRALRSGASAYVTKSSATDQLLVAVDRALEGKRYISPELTERLAEEMVRGDDSTAPHERLTERELDILRLIASGTGNNEIASTLFISIKTVSTHRSNILKKLGLQNNAELILYALRNGLVD